ncbi:MAG TPA: SAM-dependent methyltransferase [Myxococcaceae bacterium]|nr:SAM-dependent methyltransferase [Myxococcaceae bacterium]
MLPVATSWSTDRPSPVGPAGLGLDGAALTALWVAAWRADESERPDALFRDSYARTLAGPEGFELLEAARELALVEAPFVPVRTVFFDQRIVPGSQVVLLGAGMDARAFRLQWRTGTRVFEVDLPEVLALKEQRLGGASPRCIRIPVPADLTGDWVVALERRGFRPELPSVWLLEGLLLYFDESFVTSLLARVDALSAVGSTLLADIIGWTMLWMPQLQPLHDFVRELGAPWKFGTDEPEELLEPLGWEVTAYDFGAVAAEVGRWAWPVIPRAIPGVPRSFLVEAAKPAGGRA